MRGAGTAKSNGRKKGGVKAYTMIDSEHNLPCFTLLTEARHHDLVFCKLYRYRPALWLSLTGAYTHYKQFETWNAQGTTWVTRQKNDASFKITSEEHSTPDLLEKGVIADQRVILGRPSNRNKIPLINARRITFRDMVKQKDFVFITNDLAATRANC